METTYMPRPIQEKYLYNYNAVMEKEFPGTQPLNIKCIISQIKKMIGFCIPNCKVPLRSSFKV